MGTWKFDKSGTFTWPPDVFAVNVTAFSGGGGGGNTDDTVSEPDEITGDQYIDAAGGGGAGAAIVTHLIRKTAATIEITVGEGGEYAEDGGDTVIVQDGVTEVSLPGGQAANGVIGGASGNSPLGDGGTSTQTGGAGGGALDLLGVDTDDGRGQPNVGDTGGLGGIGSGFGAGQGGDGGSSDAPGVDGQAYGAGGGGHGRTNISLYGYPEGGGKGGNGVAVFSWTTGNKSQRFVPGCCCRDIDCETLRECFQVTPPSDNTSVVDFEITFNGFAGDYECCDDTNDTHLIGPPPSGHDFSTAPFLNDAPDTSCVLTRAIPGGDVCGELSPFNAISHIWMGNASVSDPTDDSWLCIVCNYINRGPILGMRPQWMFGYFGADAKAAINELCNGGTILLPPIETWPGHEGVAGFNAYRLPGEGCDTGSAYVEVTMIPP